MAKKPGIIRVMEEAAVKAGKRLVRDHHEVSHLQVSQKGPGDFVSSADIRSEEMIVEHLKNARGDAGFVLEEGGIEKPDANVKFIIDPIDGTTNFLHGSPFFCISIGYMENDELLGGVIFAPILNELFWAYKGEGAYMNDQRLMVSKRDTLELSLIGTGGIGHARSASRETKAAVDKLSQHTPAIRILGSAALELAYVAAGKLDGYFHQSLSPWDIAAGIVLVEEARGKVTELTGENNMLQTGSILASNGVLHQPLMDNVSPCFVV